MLRTASFALLLTPALATADLTVGPGGDFTALQQAIDAAAPGETILVAPGEYQGFVVTKPVSILGARRDQVIVRSPSSSTPIAIRSIPAGAEVTVASLTLAPAASGGFPQHRVVIEDCPGRVTLHDLHLPASEPTEGYAVASTLYLFEADQVVLSRTVVDARDAAPSFSPADAVSAIRSRLWLSDCDLRGADGLQSSTPGDGPTGFRGGDALSLVESTARVANSRLEGGRGGSGVLAFVLLDLPAPGGHAVHLDGYLDGLLAAPSTLFVADGPDNLLRGGGVVTTPAGGTPGSAVRALDPSSTTTLAANVVSEAGLDSAGSPGAVFPAGPVGGFDHALTFEVLTSPTLSLSQPAIGLGSSATLTARGPDTALHFPFVATSSVDAFGLAPVVGPLLIAPSAVPLPPVSIGPASEAQLTLTVPTDPLLVGAVLRFQSVELYAGALRASSIAVAPIRP